MPAHSTPFKDRIANLKNILSRSIRKNWHWFFITLHLGKMFYLLHQVRFSTGFPLTNLDFIIYYSRVLRAHEFLIRSGRFWGYDPFLMGGYVSGPICGAGVFLVGLITHFLSPLIPISTSFLVIEVGTFLAGPFLVIPTIKNFGGTRLQSWVGFAITTLMLGYFDHFTRPYRLLTVGMPWFMAAVFLAALQVSLVWQWVKKRSAKLGFWMVFVTVILLQLHPSSMLIIFLPNVLIFFLFITLLSRRDLLFLLFGVGLVFLTNAYWMVPALEFSNWLSIAPDYQASAGWRGIWNQITPFRHSSYASIQAILHLSLICLSLHTLKRWFFQDKQEFTVFVSWLLCLGLIGFFGSQIHFLEKTQPNRFIFSLWLLFFLLAAFSCDNFKTKFKKNAVMGLTILGIVIGTYDFYFAYKERLLKTTLRADQKNLIAFLKKGLPREGRVSIEMMEEEMTPQNNNPFIWDMLPFLTDHTLLGGPNPGNFLISRYCDFLGVYWTKREPTLFGRSLFDFDEKKLMRYLDFYNTAFVIAQTEESKAFFDSMPKSFSLFAEVEKRYKVYKVSGSRSWFLHGRGHISFDYDEIKIEEASPGPLILKFHWIKTLQTDPPLKIEPILISEDPVPFIFIDNSAGHPSIRISNSGKLSIFKRKA